MGILDRFLKKDTPPNATKKTELGNGVTITQPENGYTHDMDYGYRNPIYPEYYDGEKTPGELGFVSDVLPDHLSLRLRAYDANFTTLIKLITNKFFKSVIGNGLKLQAEPDVEALRALGVDITDEQVKDFKKKVEPLFRVYSNSKNSDFKGNQNLHKNALDCYSDAFLGGDSLSINRFTKNGVVNQVVDGQQVVTPFDKKEKTIIQGVEVDKKGKHIAYHVRKMAIDESEVQYDYIRIPKRDSKGREMASLIYSEKHRINDFRGVSRLSNILETNAKLDRYVEATVGKQEKSASINSTIEHDANSTGQNPITPTVGSTKPKTIDDKVEVGNAAAKRYQQVTGIKTINMPVGSKLVEHESGVDSDDFNVFTDAIIKYMASSLNMSYEYALQTFNSNYTASRGAVVSTEHFAEIDRSSYARDFYLPFYKLFLEYLVLTDKIVAPGLREAILNEDFMIVEAYSGSRWVGSKMPHIDQVKEVKAVIEMLNAKFINYEKAVEMLNAGNWEDNYKKFQEEGMDTPEENRIKLENENTKDNGEI